MGVIAVETRAVEVVIPADPGNPDSDTKVCVSLRSNNLSLYVRVWSTGIHVCLTYILICSMTLTWPFCRIVHHSVFYCLHVSPI